MTGQWVRRGVLGLAVLLPLTAVTASTGPMPQVLVQQFTKDDDGLGKKGIRPADWEHWGTLAQGDTERLVFSVRDGVSYDVVGACDKDCSNVDLKVSSITASIGADTQPDDYPLVTIPSSAKTTSYFVDVIMVTCHLSPCSYGVRAYTRPGG